MLLSPSSEHSPLVSYTLTSFFAISTFISLSPSPPVFRSLCPRILTMKSVNSWRCLRRSSPWLTRSVPDRQPDSVTCLPPGVPKVPDLPVPEYQVPEVLVPESQVPELPHRTILFSLQGTSGKNIGRITSLDHGSLLVVTVTAPGLHFLLLTVTATLGPNRSSQYRTD